MSDIPEIADHYLVTAMNRLVDAGFEKYKATMKYGTTPIVAELDGDFDRSSGLSIGMSVSVRQKLKFIRASLCEVFDEIIIDGIDKNGHYYRM